MRLGRIVSRTAVPCARNSGLETTSIFTRPATRSRSRASTRSFVPMGTVDLTITTQSRPARAAISSTTANR